MKNKLVFISGMALGYVLGTRAGRESYETIKSKADELWQNPRVQERVTDTTKTLRNKVPEFQEQATAAVKKAKESAAGAMHRAENSESGRDTTSSAGSAAGSGETPFQNQDEDTRPPLRD